MINDNKVILLSLDDIMDTRLGFIKTINPDLFEELMSGKLPEYLLRMNDSYLYKALHWNKETWNQIWKARNIDVIKNSMVNYLPDIVNKLIMEYMMSNESAIGSTEITLEINTYPYQLDGEEKEVLLEIMEELFPIVPNIHLVEIDVLTLTPEQIKKKYFMLGIYDFYTWSGLHAGSLQKIIMPNTMILAPRFFSEEVKDRKLTQDERKVFEMDPFKTVETVVAFKFKLQFIPASDYAPLIIPTVQKEMVTDDLDRPDDQSAFYTREGSLYDHLSQFHQESVLSEESH